MSDATQGVVEAPDARRSVTRTRRLLAATLVILIILAIAAFAFLLQIFEPAGDVANKKEAGGIEWVRSIYGWGNDRTQQLGSPQCVAFGPDGAVWVTDAGMARVIGFNADATFRTILHRGPRGATPDSLSFPTSVAVDEMGNVYIGDMTGSQIVVMSPENEVLRKIPAPRPRSVAVRGDRLVVGANPGFAILSKTGDVIRVLGENEAGTGPDQFNGVSGVAIGEDGSIYAVDQYNNRVSAYDADGNRKWIRTTGNPGNQTSPKETMSSQVTTAEAGMQLPAGIAIDNSGRLVVVDAFGFSLVVLNAKDGKLIATYGEPGTEDGKFVYPSAVSYDPARDYFAIADTAMSRVQIVRIPGSGGSPMATVNRTLLGPIRALLWPLALLLVSLMTWLIYRAFRRRRSSSTADGSEAEVVSAA